MDWERNTFTLDDNYQLAVKEAFVRMYEDKKVIYWANRLVNWCVALRTAISDLEVVYDELTQPKKLKVPVPGAEKDWEYEFGYFTNFVYKVKDSD